MRILESKIFRQPTEEVARDLLGKYLCRESQEGLVYGRIVETEAYLSEDDPACHSSHGMTMRNASMFGSAGNAYIYFIYGKYYCFNVVTGAEGTGEAVLIRAVEPVVGLDLMKQRRGFDRGRYQLASGPGKLCQAFAIDKALDGHDLQKKPLYLAADKTVNSRMQIMSTPRIGITSAQDRLLRFIVSGSKYLSRR